MEHLAALVRAAHAAPRLRPALLALLRAKTAGSESFPVLGKKAAVVTSQMIKNAVLKAGYLPGFFDFSKIEIDPDVDEASAMLTPPPYRKGLNVSWRVFQPGKFGDRTSEYVWGTVQVYLGSSGQGIPVHASIYVKV